MIDECLGEFLPDMLAEKPWEEDTEIEEASYAEQPLSRQSIIMEYEQLSSHVRDAAYEYVARRAVEYAMEIEDDINEMPVTDPEQRGIG